MAQTAGLGTGICRLGDEKMLSGYILDLLLVIDHFHLWTHNGTGYRTGTNLRKWETWENQAKAELSTSWMFKLVKNQVEKVNAYLQRQEPQLKQI